MSSRSSGASNPLPLSTASFSPVFRISCALKRNNVSQSSAHLLRLVSPCESFRVGLGVRATQSELIVYRAFSFAVLIMSGTIAGIEKWKEDNWTVLADWTVVRQGPQVVVSDEKSEGTTPGQV